MKRLKLNFARYTDANLLILAQAILAALTGNAFFPSPTPTLTIFQAAITAYSDALTAAKDGGKTNVTIKNARRLNLVALMVQMGNYVMLTANGNLEMLGTCSIPLSKDREPMPPLGKPVIIKIEDGVNSGDALVTIATLMGSRNFQY